MTTTLTRRARLIAGAGAAALTLVMPLAGVAGASSGRDHGGQDSGAANRGAPNDRGGSDARGRARAGWFGDQHDPWSGVRPAAWPWAGKGDGTRGADPKGKDTKTDPTVPTTNPKDDAAKLEALQRRCTIAIDRRLGQLSALGARLTAAPNLSDAHKAALAAIVSGASSGLTTLKATIASDTDPATLQGHCQEIVTGYLVYRLVTPQVHLVVAADNVLAAAGRLDEAAAKLADAIAAAKAAGQDTTAAEAKLAEMQQEIAAGRAAVAGVADSVLALRPSDAGSIASVLGSARAALASAKAHLGAAKRAGVQAAAALRGDDGKHDRTADGEHAG